MVMPKLVTLGSIVAITLTTQAFAESGLMHCAELADATKRLACFDVLVAKDPGHTDIAISPQQEVLVPEPVIPRPAENNTQDMMGSEHLIKTPSPSSDYEKEVREGVQFRVSSFKLDSERRHIFYMDNGQIWREIEPGRVYFPRGRYFNVVINQGRLEDYRLRIEGKGPFTRVVRLK